PSTAGTVAERKAARVELKEATTLLRTLWQEMKKYLVTAFAASLAEARLEEAGSALYADGATNWTSVVSMGEAGGKFIDKYSTELLAKDNMPADFKTKFADAVNKVDTTFANFTSANDKKVIAVNAKIKANNEVYDSIVSI